MPPILRSEPLTVLELAFRNDTFSEVGAINILEFVFRNDTYSLI